MITCACGMTVEQASRRTDCQECGAGCCGSCVVDLDHRTYCRWCATTLAPAA